jgi:hypothetical protein
MTIEDVVDELEEHIDKSTAITKSHNRGKKSKGTKGWTADEVQKGGEWAMKVLQTWIQRSRKGEVTPELCIELRTLDNKRLEDALKGLHQKKQWVRGKGGNSLILPVQLQALDTLWETNANALVDSGATGSYVHEQFVKDHNLVTEDLPHRVPVYNADGSPNEAGPI